MLKKIISGGQTGADQGALDAAIEHSFPYGGALPAGRKTEAGPLPEKYRMDELNTDSYPVRTLENVKRSDGTLIVSHGELSGGSALTRRYALEEGRACMHVDLSLKSVTNWGEEVSGWITKNRIKILNVAGPRASSDDNIYELTRELIGVLISLRNNERA